jgi:hypothetical protein
MEQTQLAQDRVQWQALVNAVMKLQVLIKYGEFIGQLSDYQLLINLLHGVSYNGISSAGY